MHFVVRFELFLIQSFFDNFLCLFSFLISPSDYSLFFYFMSLSIFSYFHLYCRFTNLKFIHKLSDQLFWYKCFSYLLFVLSKYFFHIEQFIMGKNWSPRSFFVALVFHFNLLTFRCSLFYRGMARISLNQWNTLHKLINFVLYYQLITI